MTTLRSFGLFMAIVLVTIGALSTSLQPAAATSEWGAGFESGTHSEFNMNSNEEGGAAIAVSDGIVHGGSFSGVYYKIGAPTGGSLRAYYSDQLSSRPSSFLVELWVYVPSVVQGQPVQLTDWTSFISIWFNEGGSSAGINPATVDSTTSRELELWLGMLPQDQRGVYQSNPIKWPFDAWFKIVVRGDLKPGTSETKIVVLQDDAEIIRFTGNLGDASTGLGQMHFGLYAGANQGTFAVYNDDISVQETVGVTSSSATTSVIMTTSSTSTSSTVSLGQMRVSVKPSSSIYRKGATVTIAVTVKDSMGKPIQGAYVEVSIQDRNGALYKKFAGYTDGKGYFKASFKIGASDINGTYTVIAKVTKPGYLDCMVSSSFTKR